MTALAEAAPGGSSLLLARQPIFDASLNVFAYELLHRSMDPRRFSVGDGDVASSQLLLDAFGPAGIANLTEGRPAFINFTEHLILNPPSVATGQIIVEVLEDIPPTPLVIDGLAALRERGFRIALDDFRHHAAMEPMLELADIVKLDVLAMSEPQLRAEVRKLRNHPLRLLAEKIESWEMHNHCVDLGFSYFQGFFLAHPQAVHGERPGPDESALLASMAGLLRARTPAEFVSALEQPDPLPGLRLLRLANGPDREGERTLATLDDVVDTLGRRTAGRASIAMLAGVTGKPRELVRLALARARACELLGNACSPGLGAGGFEAGLFSLLDAFLDRPLPGLLQSVGAHPQLRAALCERSGSEAALVATAIAFEQAQWNTAPWEHLSALGVDKADAERAYLDSLVWADQGLQAMFSR